MRKSRGLETIGTIYLVSSCLLAVMIVAAVFPMGGMARWQVVGSGIGLVFQGIVIRAVFGWMSDVARDLAGIRGELWELRPPAPDVQGRALAGMRRVAAGGAARVVDAWGAKQCSVCHRNLPLGEHASCPHCGARFEPDTLSPPEATAGT